jgi:hypothetical protein
MPGHLDLSHTENAASACRCGCKYKDPSSSYTLPARFLVPKQQFNPGTKTAPPDARKALHPPRACAGCGRATTNTGQRQQLKMAAQGPPHTCCFAVSKPNHCCRVSKDLWSASQSKKNKKKIKKIKTQPSLICRAGKQGSRAKKA